MISLIQRVNYARVIVAEQTVGEIEHGLLAFLAVEPTDTNANTERMLERILTYRVFDDGEGKMNLSLQDTQGGLLIVSQFTLAADTRKGKRPSFSSAADPKLGKQLYEHFVTRAKATHPRIATGQFGAHMKVELENDGPVTFHLHS